MRKVLVTGGAGFIGSHLCDELIAHGYSVKVLDGLSVQVHSGSARPEYLHPDVELISEFTMDEGATRSALEGVDAVIHLGAVVGVAQSMYDIADYIYFNSYGTAVLLELMMEYPIKKLVVGSSMSIYGEGDYGPSGEPIPTKESSPPDLQSIYALTKYDQERMCLLFGKAYNVPTVALRFFNCFGSRQSLNNPYTGAIAIFASRLLNGKPPIIYEDGMQRRDFVHVSDVVRGIRLALESDVKDEAINIGSGQYSTILGVAEVLAAMVDVDIEPEVTGQKRVGDIRHCYADITKARELLNYEPKVWLRDGIRELVDWLKTQTAVDRVDEHRSELMEKGLLV